MIPLSQSPTPEAYLLKKQTKGSSPPSPPPPSQHSLKSSGSILGPFPFRNRPIVVLSLLALQLLLLLSVRFLPAACIFRRNPHSYAPSPVAESAGDSCPSGRIYVYDLPPAFNEDLLAACDELNPWKSGCVALSNGGLGPPANDLAGVVPSFLLSSWYSTDQFSAEIIYHRRMLAHPCRTVDPSAAVAFYVPFYAGLAVSKHLWSSQSAADRDRECALLLRWMKDQAPWRRSNGGDHFIILGRITWDFRRSKDGDWGSSFLYMPGMENMTRLLIELNPWDVRDIGIPYPTGFHPRTAADVREWQRFLLNRTRKTLFSFVGAARTAFRDDFRTLLLGECQRAGEARCRSVDCGDGRCGNRSAETMTLFLDSVFCLQPRGDSFTRRSMFDCMLAGAVPVLFWRRSAYMQYAWYLPAGGDGREEEEWSVFIDRRDVRSGALSVTQVLEGIGEERARRMRERVVEMIPRLVYAAAEGGLGEGMPDAFDVAVEGVLRRFRQQRRHRRREEDWLV